MTTAKDLQLSALDPATALYLRDRLKQARANALEDIEGYQELLFSIERLGYVLTRHRMLTDSRFVGALHNYAPYIKKVAEQSDLAEVIPKQWPVWHVPFSDLYEIVRIARNDALHQGAFARHLTTNAITLALTLEEALMSNESSIKHYVEHYMVRDPTCALASHPLSFIRQVMLANSYSYLPVYLTIAGKESWYLISDFAVAQYLRPSTQGERNRRLATTVREAIDNKGLSLPEAVTCFRDTPIAQALEQSDGRPVLVLVPHDSQQVLGILTPFDVV